MERSETVTVSSAPEPGEVSPFERLCCRSWTVTIRMLTDGTHEWLELTMHAVADDDQTLVEETHEQRLTTDSGDPIEFDTALQLAASFLLARLEESK